MSIGQNTDKILWSDHVFSIMDVEICETFEKTKRALAATVEDVRQIYLSNMPCVVDHWQWLSCDALSLPLVRP